MKIFLPFVVALALLAAPASAQLVVQPPIGSSAGGPANQAATYEALGTDFSATGGGTTITGGSSNTYGSYATIGTTGSAWCGFTLSVGTASSSSARFILDIRVNGSTTIVNSLFVMPSTTTQIQIPIPIKVASGAAIDARVRAATASATVKVSLVGTIDATTCPPGYNTMTALSTVDTTNTRPSATQVSMNSTWTLLGTTSTAASAFYVVAGIGTSTPSATQMTAISIGTGSSGSETEIARYNQAIAASTTLLAATSPLFNRAIPNGTALSVRIAAVTTTDSIPIQVYGLN